MSELGKYNKMNDKEIDSLVAEKIMGLPMTDALGHEYKRVKVAGDIYTEVSPFYSTNIKLAFDVKNNMIERGYTFQMYFNPETFTNKVIFEKIKERTFISGMVDTGGFISDAKIICIAALKAIDRENK